MHREGHLGLSSLIYAPIAFVLALADYTTALGLGFVVFVALSSAPDYDLKLPIVKHRGITHTYLASVVTGIALAIVAVALVSSGIASDFSPPVRPTPVGFAAAGSFGFFIGFFGIVSHLLGDAFTPMGVKPYQPFSDKKITYDLFLSKSTLGNAGFLLAGMVAFIAATGGGFWINQYGLQMPL